MNFNPFLCVQHVERYCAQQEAMQKYRTMALDRWNAMSSNQRDRLTRNKNFPKQPPVLVSQSLPTPMARAETGQNDTCLVFSCGDDGVTTGGGGREGMVRRGGGRGGGGGAMEEEEDVTHTSPSHPIVSMFYGAWSRGGDVIDSQGGGSLSHEPRPWCFDLLLDVVHGIHTWDVQTDRDEWWTTDPSDFPSVNFAPACMFGGYLFNGVGSKMLDEFCGAVEKDGTLQECLDTFYALRVQFPHSPSVKAGLAGLYLYWRVEALLVHNDQLRKRFISSKVSVQNVCNIQKRADF